MDPNSFVDIPRLLQHLGISEDRRDRAEVILRARMRDILVCLPRALNGWTEAELVSTAQSDVDPPVYTSISELSPDRREFYLGDKEKKQRIVYCVPPATVAAITTDARFPLDLCCVHMDQGSLGMLVCYSSQMVRSAKVKELGQSSVISNLIRKANQAVNERGVRPEENILAKLPRSKRIRVNPNYKWIPVGQDGRFLIGAPNYPNKGSSGENSVEALRWCLWLNILGSSAASIKTRVTRMDDTTTFMSPRNFLVYKNPFHLVVQGL